MNKSKTCVQFLFTLGALHRASTEAALEVFTQQCVVLQALQVSRWLSGDFVCWVRFQAEKGRGMLHVCNR